MTLIVAAVNKFAVCVSTDTQLSFSDGHIYESDVPKSGSIECQNGRFVYSYTGGNVHLGDDDFHIADWITNSLADTNLGTTDIKAIVTQLQQRLNERVAYMRSALADLIIVIAGWIESEEDTKSVVFRITNCEPIDQNTRPNLRQFMIFEQHFKREVIARGSMKKGDNHTFDSKIKYIRKQLKGAKFMDFGRTIAPLLYDLNLVAHADPAKGKYVGDKIHITILAKTLGSVQHINLPKTKDFTSPNVSNKYISIRGIKVHNDPLNGSTVEVLSKRIG